MSGTTVLIPSHQTEMSSLGPEVSADLSQEGPLGSGRTDPEGLEPTPSLVRGEGEEEEAPQPWALCTPAEGPSQHSACTSLPRKGSRQGQGPESTQPVLCQSLEPRLG